MVAHTDAEVVDPTPFVATDMADHIIPEKVDALAPFTPKYTKKVLRLTEKAFHWCAEEQHRLEPEIRPFLPRNTWLPTEENGDT